MGRPTASGGSYERTRFDGVVAADEFGEIGVARLHVTLWTVPACIVCVVYSWYAGWSGHLPPCVLAVSGRHGTHARCLAGHSVSNRSRERDISSEAGVRSGAPSQAACRDIGRRLVLWYRVPHGDYLITWSFTILKLIVHGSER